MIKSIDLFMMMTQPSTLPNLLPWANWKLNLSICYQYNIRNYMGSSIGLWVSIHKVSGSNFIK